MPLGADARIASRTAGLLKAVARPPACRRTNDGRPLRAVREEVIKHGITINGLAILNELPLLDDYFRDHLIGGAGAFFMVAQDYPDFAQAMIHKLVREIRSAPPTKKC